MLSEYKPNIKVYTASELSEYIYKTKDGDIKCLDNIEDYIFDNMKHYDDNQIDTLLSIINAKKKRFRAEKK